MSLNGQVISIQFLNTNISDGLLFISEKEAKDFVCRIYNEYQHRIVPSNYLKITKKRLLKEIIKKK